VDGATAGTPIWRNIGQREALRRSQPRENPGTSTMREIETRLKIWKMADALGELRKWLDHNRCVPVNFEISRAATGSLLVRIVFEHDHQAKRFERDFGG
jgi:hypothetical protein